MLLPRPTLPKRLACSPVLWVWGTPFPLSPFSLSARRSIRQRPTRRTNKANDDFIVGRSQKSPSLVIGTSTSRLVASVETSHNVPPTSLAVTEAQHAASPSITSTSGPYKHVLLNSRTIYYCPERSSRVEASAVAAKGHLTARTTKQQTQQLSAAEKFFSYHHDFLYSAESLRHHPMNIHIPEIVILGSSNVGKSTFLNALVGSLEAARVSQRPGRTTLINAFGVGPLPKIPKEVLPKGTAPPKHSLILVDTPGYGYRSQVSWGGAIVKYLQSRRMLRGAVVLLSSDKKLLPGDRWILRTLAEANTRTVVVLTKADKGRTAWNDRCVVMANAVQTELDELHEEYGRKWRHGDGAATHIYITAAGMDASGKLRNGAGMGGVRAAILEMAGFTLKDTVTKKAETMTYTGPIVSFEDIHWKS